MEVAASADPANLASLPMLCHRDERATGYKALFIPGLAGAGSHRIPKPEISSCAVL
jgi:hypothetical protein